MYNGTTHWRTIHLKKKDVFTHRDLLIILQRCVMDKEIDRGHVAGVEIVDCHVQFLHGHDIANRIYLFDRKFIIGFILLCFSILYLFQLPYLEAVFT